MTNPASQTPPPDQLQRERALHPLNSVLVQAPAGSGKTDLLTRRFLSLLAQVAEPGQIVAITFTKAAAAEMRHRILHELERAAARTDAAPDPDAFSMEHLAQRALAHSKSLGWNLLDQPAQLRIATIDSFCREIALQQPLLSGLCDGLGIYEQPDELYRRAARRTLQQIGAAEAGAGDPALTAAIEFLLLWRDNNWQEMEDLLIQMLQQRDRWMHAFVLDRDPDEDELRRTLERPFAKAIAAALAAVSQLLDQLPGVREEALALARFACEQGAGALFQTLAELADFPSPPWASSEDLEGARQACACLCTLLLTNDGGFRKQVNKRLGFPTDRKREKAQLLNLIARLSAIPDLESALAAVRSLPPAHYTDEDWQIVRASFTLLRRAAAELRIVFAEAGAADYTEVAQTALNVLRSPDGSPTDAAISLADNIHHILVDEFQDTCRRQHDLLRGIIAAWPEREGRTCFVVGDPMQSIYFFRDADAELFPRVRDLGLEIPGADPFLFNPLALTSNFRTVAPLVKRLNDVFAKVFEVDDGSGIQFASAEPAPQSTGPSSPIPVQPFQLHLSFEPRVPRAKSSSPGAADEKEVLRAAQIEEIVQLIRSHAERMQQARVAGRYYRIAVLGRTRNALAPIAQVLHEAQIPFRGVDLERLAARPEVLDALSLARALLNPVDRVAWLGVLRAPWCGLALSDLHMLTSADNPEVAARPVPELLGERLHLLATDARLAVERVLQALAAAAHLRFSQPAAALGTWLQQVWLLLGGAACVDPAARANLNLLWQTLDALPNGEPDLLGPALPAALDKLTAQPDPNADADCGVQLMTIHKAKGLEFEVVIVPELQARSRQGAFKMLSWLERGLPPQDISDDPEEITEFLVAPLQSKGADGGSTKQWVDHIYREREAQENRRILYVAATRARNELHLFARLACKQNKKGGWILAEPVNSLLATAWPALATEIGQRFEEWKEALPQPQAESAAIESIAASGESNLLQMPVPLRPTILRRLPPSYIPPAVHVELPRQSSLDATPASKSALYTRHEGGLLSRALGTATHAFLEELSRLRIANDWPAARSAIKQFQPAVAARICAVGIDPGKASAIAAEALGLALNAAEEPTGQWILSPHPQAASELGWVGIIDGALRTVQVDRIFRAGLAPLSSGDDAWWIIDYKTAHAAAPDPLASAAVLPSLRALFAPQLEAYAQLLRNLHGKDALLRAGLYYPRMSLFDWWEI